MPIPSPQSAILRYKSMHEGGEEMKKYTAPRSEFYEADTEDILTLSSDSPLADLDNGNTNEFGVYH